MHQDVTKTALDVNNYDLHILKPNEISFSNQESEMSTLKDKD